MIGAILTLCQFVTILWLVGVVLIVLWLTLTGQLCGLLREHRKAKQAALLREMGDR